LTLANPDLRLARSQLGSPSSSEACSTAQPPAMVGTALWNARRCRCWNTEPPRGPAQDRKSPCPASPHGALRWSDRPPAPTVDDADVARLSPLARRHLNVHGRYSFTLPELPGGLRPLRDPDQPDEGETR
jgi:hypothetical protein